MALVPNALIFLLGEELDRTFAIQSQLVRAGVQNPIFALRDFEESKRHLLNLAEQSEWTRVLRPHLAIVTLDEEGVALDFLQWLKREPRLNGVRVILLADQRRPRDVQAGVEFGVNDFYDRDGDLPRLAADIIGMAAREPGEEAREACQGRRLR
jgi:DNA-binding NarL/FixJ family response regulator